MTAPTHTNDLVHGALRVLYPSTADTLGDLVAAHAADYPTAWEIDARGWYEDQGIDVLDGASRPRSLADMVREYWIGTGWIADASDIRVTEDGEPRVTEDDILREVE